MPSRTDTVAHEKPVTRQALDIFKIWNRKGHYYLGLYFLFFLWLFAFTGLLLNHSWQFAEFWPTRKISKSERSVEMPHTGSDLDRARDIMRQLGIAGEIEWTAAKPGSTLFEFRANRPGYYFAIGVDPQQGRATVEQTEINGWGILRVLHTFTGVRAGDTRNERDWILTEIWALSMDAVAAGMILMVLSGLYLWWGLTGKRMLGAIALLLGTSACGFFVVGLRWLYA